MRKIANFSQLSTSKELPSVADTLLELLNPSGGTVLEFSEKDIQFHNPLSPVKSLHVAICSSEQEDISVLHKIHLMTRI